MKKQKRILFVLMTRATLIATQAGCGRKPIKSGSGQKIVGQKLRP